jgi:hypothetical protein
VVLGPLQFFFQQLLVVNPFAAPIWLAGLFALLFWRPLRPYRALGWAYLVSYMVIFLQHGKSYYLAPVYPMLFGAGAVAIDAVLGEFPARLAWLKPVVAAIILVNGIYLIPITVPVLSPDRFLA